MLAQLSMQNRDSNIPDPLSKKQYSGKFMMRVTPDKHKELAILAAEQNVSLNRYISSKI